MLLPELMFNIQPPTKNLENNRITNTQVKLPDENGNRAKPHKKKYQVMMMAIGLLHICIGQVDRENTRAFW